MIISQPPEAGSCRIRRVQRVRLSHEVEDQAGEISRLDIEQIEIDFETTKPKHFDLTDLPRRFVDWAKYILVGCAVSALGSALYVAIAGPS